MFTLRFRVLPTLGLSVFSAPFALAQSTPQTVEPVVVTGTRNAQNPFNLPMSIDAIDGEALREGRLGVNLSEALQSIPGLNIQNRQNYAQDLQISSRGFGGRASFGVRGIKLITDGIPASQPDGQGQVSHFGLGSAERVEVLRGPFSVLYGNAAGGVIQIITEDASKQPSASVSVSAGSNETWRAGIKASGRSGNLGIVFDAQTFDTQGARPQSAAERNNSNAKFTWASGGTQVTVIGNAMRSSLSQDPLGLTRAEFDANPNQTTAVATQFNTRKQFEQQQAGVRIVQALPSNWSVEGMVYAGDRSVNQYQAIPVATQAPATHPGGVIDFDRNYYGGDLRVSHSATHGAARGQIVLGVSADRLNEDRRGYQNFIGSTLGVIGALRRNEDNRVDSVDAYAQHQLTWGPINTTLGIRSGEVRFKTVDKYIVGTNPDDSGEAKFKKTTPAAGLSFKAMPTLNLYVSAGRGFETPTFNELAYRAGGQTGLNFALKPAVSDSVEVGLKWRSGQGAWATLAAFDTRTRDEIVTLTNSGGRSSFQNAGRTRRQGLEAATSWQLPLGLEASGSVSSLSAEYRESFKTCIAAPCTTPTVDVAAGNQLPGVPKLQAYTELKWSHASGVSAALEAKHQGKVFVNDLNTDAAGAWTTLGARVSYVWQRGGLKVTGALRGDNLTDRRYAGSVIVNEGNSRFFETAPGRTWLASVSVGGAF